MNQTADPPNQPKTTVCILDINKWRIEGNAIRRV